MHMLEKHTYITANCLLGRAVEITQAAPAFSLLMLLVYLSLSGTRARPLMCWLVCLAVLVVCWMVVTLRTLKAAPASFFLH